MDSSIKNCLEEYRKGASWTQVELAEKVGVTRQTIIAIERGDYNPSVTLALSLAHALKINVEDIFQLL